MTHIVVPPSVESGKVLTVYADPASYNFSAGLYKDPKEIEIDELGRKRKAWKGTLIQVEQEGSGQEGPRADGQIHLEMKDRRGQPLPTGQYLVKVWHQNWPEGAFRKDFLVRVF